MFHVCTNVPPGLFQAEMSHFEADLYKIVMLLTLDRDVLMDFGGRTPVAACPLT